MGRGQRAKGKMLRSPVMGRGAVTGGGGGGGGGNQTRYAIYRHQLIRSKHPLLYGSGQLYNWLAIVTKGMTFIFILMLSSNCERRITVMKQSVNTCHCAWHVHYDTQEGIASRLWEIPSDMPFVSLI